MVRLFIFDEVEPREERTPHTHWTFFFLRTRLRDIEGVSKGDIYRVYCQMYGHRAIYVYIYKLVVLCVYGKMS